MVKYIAAQTESHLKVYNSKLYFKMLTLFLGIINIAYKQTCMLGEGGG